MRPVPVLNLPTTTQAIFITGGIGDVFAVESFMTDAERSAVEAVFYATIKRAYIESVFQALPSFPNIKYHVNVWDDFSQFWCFFSKEDCLKRLTQTGSPYVAPVSRCTDLSISGKFPDIKNKRILFTGSSFLKHTLADISRHKLPEKYVALCPFSSDKRIRGRDFTPADWDKTIDLLRLVDAKGVVLNVGNDPVPKSPQLIDLTNHCTLVESIEILKQARAYVGIDTALSVLAAQRFPYPRCVIKLLNPHGYDNLACYYPTQTNHDFVMREVRIPPDFHL